MNAGMEQFLEVFFEEAEEHLANLEHLLLTLDLASPDREALDGIFRAAHSIKGSSGMFGFGDLTAVTHVLETLLDKIRSGQIALRVEMVDVFLQARDVLGQLLACHKHPGTHSSIPTEGIVERLQALIDNPSPGASESTAESAYGLFEHETEQPASDGLFEGDPTSHTGEDAFGFFDDQPSASPALAPTEPNEAYGLFNEATATSSEEAFGLEAPSQNQTPINSPASADIAPAERRAGDRRNTANSAAAPSRPAGDAESSSIRVSVEKIDSLINQVGELVITQAMLAQLTAGLDPAVFEKINQALSQLEHNTRELQESVMSIRMLPISFIFNRFPRVVRDTASKLGKKVELILQGEHTELDKGVIEKLTDPLTHIIRNSIDHGIELPADRLAAGKPEHGTVRLSAFHQGGRIVVEINDDGKGLARAKILAKAREKGMPVHDDMPDSEVWQLIFMPGFSTADVVTDLSGRGVGMDVVRRNISAIGGRIDVESYAGVGTRITIRLPLTLAILDGMIVAAGDVHYVIPLTYIIESLQPKYDDIRSMRGSERTVIRVRGEYLTLLSLHALLKLEGEPPPPWQAIVLILEAEGRKFALLVDDLIGQQQVVIKSLEQNFRRIDGITGATIMGDGSVALILDVDALPRLAGHGELAYDPNE
ncbi:chemotaxis protein CheA [Pseudomonas sp. SL4(2022)]|uniref:chemotaxis protein CheA n=1 Tax=Pseudomonas sp. SL4(2022) TaxID=2994661 RepID=UPI00226EAA9F|nr:chemotaxis protein CheA [Pseudomonas sp. SL4(2022)]WAC46558.1 chemotaxis protein CheA [Pseudomonas sp. SL4(2022)]